MGPGQRQKDRHDEQEVHKVGTPTQTETEETGKPQEQEFIRLVNPGQRLGCQVSCEVLRSDRKRLGSALSSKSGGCGASWPKER